MIAMDTIADIRRALGLSQSEMAERMGLTQSSFSRFETGELPLDKRTLLAAQALLDRAA
jgi:transcriptional regulator with XRE-family HTH domain